MAYIKGLSDFKPQIGKGGKPYFQIVVTLTKGQGQCTSRYYFNENHSKKTIIKETETFAADFEAKCRSGEILSRPALKKQEEAQKIREAEEAARTYTLKRFVDEIYMPSLILRCTPNTEDNYRRLLRLHIYPKIGDLTLTTIRPSDISAFLRGLLADEKSISIAEKCYTVLHAAFHQAYMEEFIDRDPMDRVARPKVGKDMQVQVEEESYTESEVAQIISRSKNEPLVWQAIIMFLIDSGCRIGECLGLQWKNVDFENNRVKIDGSLNYNSKLGVFRGTTKNGEAREFRVSDDVMALLSVLRQHQQLSVQSEYVFTMPSNILPVHPQSPRRYFKKFGEKYSIKEFHPHKLRHTYISIAMTNGADPVSVAAKVGHKDVTVTFEKYSHTNKEKIDGTTDIFRAAIEKKINQIA